MLIAFRLQYIRNHAALKQRVDNIEKFIRYKQEQARQRKQGFRLLNNKFL